MFCCPLKASTFEIASALAPLDKPSSSLLPLPLPQPPAAAESSELVGHRLLMGRYRASAFKIAKLTFFLGIFFSALTLVGFLRLMHQVTAL
jgi:hypothetical protein